MKRVLIVDDQSESRYLLRALMQSHGYLVDEAHNGIEALAAARRHLPELVISDLLMPGMDGYTLLREWKNDETLRQIPFIVFSATYTSPPDEKLAFDCGADAFIVKPLYSGPFMMRVNEVLESVSQGGPKLPRMPADNEKAVLKLYSEVLVHKLETRNDELAERVAELARAEARYRRLSQLYAAISATNHAIVHLTESEALLPEVCRIAVERGGLAMAWIGMIDATSGDVIPVANCGIEASWLAQNCAFNLHRLPRTPVEIALGQGQVYVCNDLQADPALAPIYQPLRQQGLRSAASCPLHCDGRLIGALTLFARETGFFDDSLAGLVTDMAVDVSFALDNYAKEAQRKEAVKALQRLNAELDERVATRTTALAATNQELENFIYSVSHDLRAPLRAIDGFSQILLEDYRERLDDTGHKHLGRVSNAARRMGTMIDDLLELSKFGRREPLLAPVDLSEMALAIFAELAESLSSNRAELRVAPDCHVIGDAKMLHALLQNLLDNALKYTARTPQAIIEFGSEPGPSGTVYFVRDNGVGFDMQHAARLFQPFQRFHTAEEFAGTGIGLATVARVVRSHDGKLWAESKPGEGATFRFTVAMGSAAPG